MINCLLIGVKTIAHFNQEDDKNDIPALAAIKRDPRRTICFLNGYVKNMMEGKLTH